MENDELLETIKSFGSSTKFTVQKKSKLNFNKIVSKTFGKKI